MLQAIWPLVILVLGLLLWFASSNAKASEAGRIAYFVGLFWVAYVLSGHSLKIT